MPTLLHHLYKALGTSDETFSNVAYGNLRHWLLAYRDLNGSSRIIFEGKEKNEKEERYVKYDNHWSVY